MYIKHNNKSLVFQHAISRLAPELLSSSSSCSSESFATPWMKPCSVSLNSSIRDRLIQISFYIAKNCLFQLKKMRLWHRLSRKNKLIWTSIGDLYLIYILLSHTLEVKPLSSKRCRISWSLQTSGESKVYTAGNAPKVYPTSKIRGTQNVMVSYWKCWNVSFPFSSNKSARFLTIEFSCDNRIPTTKFLTSWVILAYLLSFRGIFRCFLDAPFRWVCETPWAAHLRPPLEDEQPTKEN